jgi:transcriptional regulator with XRE-family HTH domain
MLTPRQIRAARGLLGWEATELGKRTKLSRETIANIEAGRTQAREGSIERIAQAFIEGGVEFTEQNGVRLKSRGVDVLTGREGLQEFFDGVYEYAREHGGTIVQFGVDEKQFFDHLGAEFSAHYVKRMQAVHRERSDLKVKAIICEGETDYLAPDYNEYRWISKEIFRAVPFYICGETLAVMDFQSVPAPTIVLLKFPAITNAYRTQFEAFWNIAREIPQSAYKAKGK